ncbi:MAG: thiol:disulfide interchange protein [Campylobacteraceae bacterium]|jgi:thiol:disulfide interchange protein DsbA|nr:thiol:disulfide interchange protein [Campylobacteraceae bacterium]
MKKIYLSICRVLAAIGFLHMSAFGFSEGVDYITLETPIANMNKTLIKVFSYTCSTCYEDDKAEKTDIIKEIESIVEIKPFHVKTQGIYAKEASEIFAVLLIKDRDNGITSIFDKNSQFKKAKMAYYNAYHEKRSKWKIGGESFIRTGLNASGLSMDEFKTLKNDPRVKELLDMWDNNIAEVQNVPVYVVNGKYLINSKKINLTNDLAEIIKELADK